MGIKNFFKHKILGIPEFTRELIVELPQEAEKRKTAQIRLQNEKIRDLSIELRKFQKEILKYKKSEDKIKEDKIIIREVFKKAKKQKEEKLKTKAVYQLIYPDKKPFIQYGNGKGRIYDGFEINETKEGTPLFRLRFYSPETKAIIPLQLDAQELTFFFKNIIGLATQHNTGIIDLNIDEIEGKPVFMNSEIDFIRSSQISLARLSRELARKDDEIRNLRGKLGSSQELQAEQEKDLSDMDMSLRYAKKDAEFKSAKLESVMQINLATNEKLKQDHIDKGMSELKMAHSLRTLQAYEENNQILNQKLADAYSSDAYDLGKKDTLELLDKITKNILAVQSATKMISSQIKTSVMPEKPKEEGK